MASPYDIGAQVGKGISGAFSAYRQDNVMDKLLQQASQSNDPNQIQNLMGMLITQVSPDRRQDAIQLLTARMSDIKSKNTLNNMADALESRGYPRSFASFPPTVLKELFNPVDRVKQQSRLDRDSVDKHFNAQIREVDNELKNEFMPSRRSELIEKKRQLQQQRDEAWDYFGKDKKKKLEKFDASKPEHKQEAEMLFEQLGDKNKVLEILKEKYSFE